MENRILNIKLTEKDFKKIKIILVSYLIKLNDEDKTNNLEENDKTNFEIDKIKSLIAKLEEAELYNHEGE